MDQNIMENFLIIIFMDMVFKNIIKGIYIWADKRRFEGNWKNNKMDGFGVFIWPDQRKYEGNYRDDKKEGYGLFEWYFFIK